MFWVKLMLHQKESTLKKFENLTFINIHLCLNLMSLFSVMIMMMFFSAIMMMSFFSAMITVTFFSAMVRVTNQSQSDTAEWRSHWLSQTYCIRDKCSELWHKKRMKIVMLRSDLVNVMCQWWICSQKDLIRHVYWTWKC